MSMLEYFYKSRWHLQNLRQGPLSTHIDGLAARLNRLGFTKGSARRYLCLTGKFNDFARAERVETVEQITERLIERFIKEELPSQGIFKQARSDMHQLWEYLCEEKIVTGSATTLSDDPFDIILRKYDEHLSNARGLVPTSRSQYLRYARQFLIWLQDHRGEKALERVNGVDILEFITEFAGRHRSSAWRKDLCSLTRVFLRHLKSEGVIASELDLAVPRLPQWRLSSIPRHLPWEQVCRLIESVDTGRPAGLRDKAVLLLIATVGLRSQEVRSLQLGDIGWRSAEIRLRKTKTRRERVLPLPGAVGAAIADYLLRGRPRISFPQVFLRHKAPLGPLTSTHGIGNIIGKHLLRAGIPSSCRGAHLLRHSLATRMVNQAVPIKQIANMLGHTSIDTTAIYTKVDTTNLKAVALSFPGGEP
jgi:integrase/recombinase XerD